MVENIIDSEEMKREEEGCLRFDNMKQLREFRESLYDVVNDRRWCNEHGIDYMNPSLRDAAQILYDKLFSERAKSV